MQNYFQYKYISIEVILHLLHSFVYQIGNEILTMKKVNTVTDASDDDSVGSLAALLGAADNDNFFQQLQLSTPLRQQQQQRPQQQQPDVNRFRQQQLNELRQQLGQLARNVPPNLIEFITPMFFILLL